MFTERNESFSKQLLSFIFAHKARENERKRERERYFYTTRWWSGVRTTFFLSKLAVFRERENWQTMTFSSVFPSCQTTNKQTKITGTSRIAEENFKRS
jgi:hypothetical protein